MKTLRVFEPLFGKKTVAPNLEPLFTTAGEMAAELQIEVTFIRCRWLIRSDYWRDGDRILTRAEVLRISAGNALDFDFPVEKRGDVVFVDLRRLDRKSKSILVIDASFMPDLKRLKLALKDGRLYARTFRQTPVGWKSHLCPVISVVGAKKYGQSWDVVFLTTRTVSGDSLDLRAANVRIPSLEHSTNTVRMNKKFDKDTLLAGFRDGWLTANATNARPNKAKGYGPDSDEDDVRAATVSKLHVPATEGQRTEIDLVLAHSLTEPTNADLFVP